MEIRLLTRPGANDGSANGRIVVEKTDTYDVSVLDTAPDKTVERVRVAFYARPMVRLEIGRAEYHRLSQAFKVNEIHDVIRLARVDALKLRQLLRQVEDMMTDSEYTATDALKQALNED